MGIIMIEMMAALLGLEGDSSVFVVEGFQFCRAAKRLDSTWEAKRISLAAAVHKRLGIGGDWRGLDWIGCSFLILHQDTR